MTNFLVKYEACQCEHYPQKDGKSVEFFCHCHTFLKNSVCQMLIFLPKMMTQGVCKFFKHMAYIFVELWGLPDV